jgi:endoglucanase
VRLVAASLVALVLAGAAIAVLTARDGPVDGAAGRFLERYVEDDGRVVRRDQGGDTVSEGQAYALLLAAAEGDEERFARVWAWTRDHLRRPDGLLAWRWADGRVADPEAASDADLDTARALLLAAERFGEPAYERAGRALARAVAAHETAGGGPAAGAAHADGGAVLVAGPWARDRAVVNPGYWSPRAFAALGQRGLAASARRLVDRLTRSSLPPDWASAGAPTGPPAGGDPQYSYDALRVPIRLAESCDPADRALAARLWPRLREHPGAPARALDGTPLTGAEHPAALAAAAAAARAAGDRAAASTLLDRAARLDAEQPTYYGAAWVALAHVMLETGALGSC